MKSLDIYDWIAISLYFLVLAGIAFWVIRKKQSNTEDYFLAGRNVGWFVVGASIFASNIGSEHGELLARKLELTTKESDLALVERSLDQLNNWT